MRRRNSARKISLSFSTCSAHKTVGASRNAGEIKRYGHKKTASRYEPERCFYLLYNRKTQSSTRTFFKCQISLTYSSMVRSELKGPAAAVFLRHIFAQFSSSAYALSTRSCASA